MLSTIGTNVTVPRETRCRILRQCLIWIQNNDTFMSAKTNNMIIYCVWPTKNVPQHSNANILYILSKATMFSPFEIFLNQNMSCVSWHSVVLKFIKKDLIAAISFRQRFSEGRKNIARHKTQKVCVQNPPWVMLQTIIYMLGNMGLAAK